MSIVKILLGAVIYMVVGSIWYHPKVFGTTWMKLVGLKMSDVKKDEMGKLYGTMFVGAILSSAVITYVLKVTQVQSLMNAFIVAIIVWLGFTAVPFMSSYLFEGRPNKLLMLTTGYHLVSVLLITTMMMVWR